LKRPLSFPVSMMSQWWVGPIEQCGRHVRGFAEFETNLRRERQLEGVAKGEGCQRLQHRTVER
jgi:hypothetical protein